MSKRNNRIPKENLALAMAAGSAVKDWADAKGVAQRTARTWSHLPEVVTQVDAIRREVLDPAIGRLSDRAVAAAEQITRLADDAASEAVRLQAARAVLADLMTVSNYSALEARMTDVERRIADARSQ